MDRTSDKDIDITVNQSQCQLCIMWNIQEVLRLGSELTREGAWLQGASQGGSKNVMDIELKKKWKQFSLIFSTNGMLG